MNLDDVAAALLPEQRASDTHVYGSVKSVNADGSYDVRLNASSVTTRCAACCTAQAGDRVLVLIQANGRCAAVGRVGGDVIVNRVEDVSNYIAGRVFAYAGTDEPTGALLCDGRAVSRNTYWELFAAIGTTYGAGDGSTTFNLPNIESRTIIGESDSYALGSTGGEEKHTLTVDEMPSHKPRWRGYAELATGGGYTAAIFDSDFADHLTNEGKGPQAVGGNQPHNNMQPYIVMRYFITTGKGDPVSGTNPADYVVEWGTTGIWHWEKYASGIAKFRGYQDFSVNFGGDDSAFAPVVNFPFELASLKYKDCSIVYSGGNEAMRIEAGSLTNKSLTDTGAYTIVARNPTHMQSGTLFFKVEGTWKDSPASSGVAVGHFDNATVENDLSVGGDITVGGKSLLDEIEALETVQTNRLNNSIVVSVVGNVAEVSWYDTKHLFTNSWAVMGNLPCGYGAANPDGVYLTGSSTDGAVNSAVYVSASGQIQAMVPSSNYSNIVSFGCGTLVVKKS